MVMALPYDQEITGSIFISAMGVSFGGKLSYGKYRPHVFVFVCPFTSSVLLLTGQGNPRVCDAVYEAIETS